MGKSTYGDSQKRYDAAHAEVRKVQRLRSQAKRFLTEFADEDDIEIFKEIINERKNKIKS
ncbi:hypothetical protein ESZ50_02310 [Weissella muntiaci]|uniref:Uncharacterized protein n=1 Tax=Weissella muntiaci TaxID=2508881 RepID=A0A6C2C921_9LACO|nr:hypothetical protein [Weissella muntiaci]TYC50521.1 hypothetical protein ESZ50_02310 [Weissella muntiaci]